MSALHNILVHDYFGIDITRIMRIVETELTRLEAAVQGMLGEL